MLERRIGHSSPCREGGDEGGRGADMEEGRERKVEERKGTRDGWREGGEGKGGAREGVEGEGVRGRGG